MMTHESSVDNMPPAEDGNGETDTEAAPDEEGDKTKTSFRSDGQVASAQSNDMVRMRLLLHGGAAVLGVNTRPDVVSAALNTWIGGGAAGHDAGVFRRYLCHHRIALATSYDPEKAILHVECPKEAVGRAFEVLHALMMFPHFEKSSLDQVKLAVHERLERLETMLAPRTGVDALGD